MYNYYTWYSLQVYDYLYCGKERVAKGIKFNQNIAAILHGNKI